MTAVVTVQYGQNIRMESGVLQSNLCEEIRRIWRQHNPADKELSLDINLLTFGQTTDTLQVTVHPNKEVSNPNGITQDMQLGLAEVIHKIRGWQYFVDVTLVENDRTRHENLDSSPFRVETES